MAKEVEFITVTLINWDESKYKPRKDVEHPTWFKCSNRLLEDPDFYKFTSDERLAWYRILELVSQKQSQTIRIDLEHCDRACRIPRNFVMSAVSKLVELGLLTADVTPTLRPRNADGTQNRIEKKEKKRIEKNREEPPADFDFDSIYMVYPRHEKKDAARKRFEKEISPDDRLDFIQAVNHYALVCKKRKTETGFIQLMTTFIGCEKNGRPWRDLVERPRELDAPAGKGAPPAGGYQRDTNPNDEFNEIINGVTDDAS